MRCHRHRSVLADDKLSALLPCASLGSTFRWQAACQPKASPSPTRTAHFTQSCSPEPQLLLYHSSFQNLKEIAKLQQLSVTATREGNVSTRAVQPRKGQEGWGQDELHLLPPGRANQLIPAADHGFCTCGIPACCKVSQPQSCHVRAHLQVRSCQLAEQQACDTMRSKGVDGLQHSPAVNFSPCHEESWKGALMKFKLGSVI